MKILVAEDDAVSNNFLVQLLSPYGEVDRVVDGMETLEAYSMAMQEGKPYEILFLDIMMPKVDGVRVLKAIRNYESKKGIKPENSIKVVLTTALSETEYVKRAMEIGCDGCIPKPIDAQEVYKIIGQFKNRT